MTHSRPLLRIWLQCLGSEILGLAANFFQFALHHIVALLMGDHGSEKSVTVVKFIARTAEASTICQRRRGCSDMGWGGGRKQGCNCGGVLPLAIPL